MSGFHGPGSPTKQLAPEERARDRRFRYEYDEATRTPRRLKEQPAVGEVRGVGGILDSTGEGPVQGDLHI